MSVFTPEFREWFTTAEGDVLVPYLPGEDTPSEQSSPPYTKTAIIDGVLTDLIFVENGEPTEAIWKKLFSSLTFKLNNGDRALQLANALSTTGDVKAGLVVLADDSMAKARDNGVVTDYSAVVTPSQLPEVVEWASLVTPAITGFNTFWENNNYLHVTVALDTSVTTRDKFRVSLSTQFLYWLKGTFAEMQHYVDNKRDTFFLQIYNGLTEAYETSNSEISWTLNPRIVGTSPLTSKAEGGAHAVKLYIREISTGGSFTAVETAEIASKASVYHHVETALAALPVSCPLATFNGLNDVVTATGGLIDRVSTVESQVAALNTNVATYVPAAGGTFTGPVVFTTVRPTLTLEFNATNSGDALAKHDLDLFSATVYTKTEVDTLINALSLRITAQDQILAAMTTSITNLTTKITELESAVGAKADANHTHANLVSIPTTVVADGTYTLTRVSVLQVSNGIITNITT